jgi:hypothetical protein
MEQENLRQIQKNKLKTRAKQQASNRSSTQQRAIRTSHILATPVGKHCALRSDEWMSRFTTT